MSHASDVDEDSPIREGLIAWTRGDLDALERVLDPAVILRAVQPGPWDCENRQQVMSLLRQRAAERHGEPSPEVEVHRIDESTFRVSGLGGGDSVATLVKLAGGKVISLQQVSTDHADPTAEAAVAAIRCGDVAALTQILTETPDLVRMPVPRYQGRTLLHVATDWPGYLPNGPKVVQGLIEHGADPNHRGGNGKKGETPLHWAASSDDVDVARALLDGGADTEAPDGSIGTPLDNAIGYGCWHVAELLAARGARIDKLWHAAALGRLDRLETLLAASPDQDQVSQAFWHACAASQRRAAERLLDEEPTSRGHRTMPRGRRSTPRAGSPPVSRTSSNGSRNAARPRQSPPAEPHCAPRRADSCAGTAVAGAIASATTPAHLLGAP